MVSRVCERNPTKPMQSIPEEHTQDTASQPGVADILFEEVNAAGASLNRKGRVNAWILLGGSLVLFAGLGVFSFDLPSLIMLVIAIFIHELGHVLGMKLFRYKNIKMLFIPLFGGAAVGTPGRQDAFRIAMISILGPAFGLLSCYLAMVVWLFFRHDFLITYVNISFFINAFNLLPILPLDGGHFMNETLFSRFPKAELLFSIVAFFALVYIAYRWSSWGHDSFVGLTNT